MIRDLAKQIADKRLEIGTAIATAKALEYAKEEHQISLLSRVDYAGQGKNEAERKMRLDSLLREDAEWARLHNEAYAARQSLAALEVKLEALQDLRRGEEWLIRAALAGLDVTSDDEELRDGIFDDVATERRVVQAVERFRPPPPPERTFNEEVDLLYGNNEEVPF